MTKAGVQPGHPSPGKKNFDFDINQFSISAQRAKAVDFSSPYYSASQAIITLADSPFAGATSLADLKGAKLGAADRHHLAHRDRPDRTRPPRRWSTTTPPRPARPCRTSQVDAIVADLPTAYYLTSAEITGAKIVGEFQPTRVSRNGSDFCCRRAARSLPCVNAAVDSLNSDGTLTDLQIEWLTRATNVPELK